MRCPSEAGRATLRILTRQLRAVTTDQLVQLLANACDADELEARKALRCLSRSGLVTSRRLVVSAPVLGTPLYSWRPRQPVPHVGAVAWAASQRLAARRPVPTNVHWATPRAVRRCGGVGGRLRKPLQLDHDLGVAAALVARADRFPTAMTCWVGEDLYVNLGATARREKVPDAVELGEDGRPVLAIDYISDYPSRRLQEFHDFWSLRRVRYEWW